MQDRAARLPVTLFVAHSLSPSVVEILALGVHLSVDTAALLVEVSMLCRACQEALLVISMLCLYNYMHGR